MIFRQVPTDPDHDDQAEDALFYRDTLQELIQIGTDLARLLHQQAIADAQAAAQGLASATPLADHAATFDRIARAIRRTITLARSLNEPTAPAPDHTAQPRAAARTPTLHGAGQGAGHPAAVTPGRDDSAAGANAPSADLHDRREVPDRDRPDRPDRDAPDRDDDTGRPPAAVIADIRRDLGLDTPPGNGAWTPSPPAGRTPADVELLCAHTAAPSSAGPQDIECNAAQHCPANTSPTGHKPGGPISTEPEATSQATGPTPASSDAPGLVATVLHHPITLPGRQSPPPRG